jgi:CheY-like chemotaxis protein
MAIDQLATIDLSSALREVRVLLVEDSPDNQILISRFLNMAGASVDIAQNGEEGVRLALDHAYDLILMDIQMPVMDGYEATLRLRGRGYRHPILALTAHAMKEERDRCLGAGCNAHLTKPIDRRSLVCELRAVLDQQST